MKRLHIQKLTSAIGQILHVGGIASDDSIFVSILCQTLIDLVCESLHDQPELFVREDQIFARIFYLEISKLQVR